MKIPMMVATVAAVIARMKLFISGSVYWVFSSAAFQVASVRLSQVTGRDIDLISDVTSTEPIGRKTEIAP